MSQQHLKWIELVKERIEKRGWSQTDLAIVVGVTPSAITQLFKDGKGSDDLKLRINKKLRINEPWEKFEEQEGIRMNEILERIAKSLESIDAELKARNEDRKILINQAEQIEKTCLEIKEDPFGLDVLKEKALADKAKQKE